MEIIFAVEDLKTPEITSGSKPQNSLRSQSNQYDVFISYRRVGGAGAFSMAATMFRASITSSAVRHLILFNPSDFAQLLKILLKAQGLEIFLDVDNLANTGAFDDQLWKHLSATKNVVLVWTKGCMDRFLGDEDVAQQDFVRKE
jgi:hypothetical protein